MHIFTEGTDKTFDHGHNARFDDYGFRCVTDMSGAPLDEEETFDVEG